MSQEDFTSEEREAFERLRNNAPDAPEALASLDEDGRARVLRELSSMATGADASDDPTATEGSSSETVEDEPTLDSASGSQSFSPSTFADRLLAQKVTVVGKQVPIIPSSVVLVLVVVAVILLVRACGGGGDPLEVLATRGMDAVDELDDHADKVGDERLFDAADRVRDDMRTLMRAADADYNDFDEILSAGEAVAELGGELLGYVEIAVTATGRVTSVDAIRAAIDAAQSAGRLLTNDEVLDQAESLAQRLLDTHIEENARRPDSEEVDEFRSAAEDLIEAAQEYLITRVNFELKRLELAELHAENRTPGSREMEEIQDSIEEHWDESREASRDYDQAVDDFCYFEERVEWRGGVWRGHFPSC